MGSVEGGLDMAIPYPVACPSLVHDKPAHEYRAHVPWLVVMTPSHGSHGKVTLLHVSASTNSPKSEFKQSRRASVNTCLSLAECFVQDCRRLELPPTAFRCAGSTMFPQLHNCGPPMAKTLSSAGFINTPPAFSHEHV